MDKALFQEKKRCQQEAEEARIKSLALQVTNKVNVSSITAESPYYLFELSFGANMLKEINNFLYSLDESEFDSYPNLNDPLLSLCQKFLDWKIEVGSDRLSHELQVSVFGHDNVDNSECLIQVIKKAWEEIKKEHGIIDTAKQAYKEHLNKTLEEHPNMPSEDPSSWCSLCDGFSEFEALQQFGYPLPFDTIFGAYTKIQPQNNSKLLEE